MESNNSERATIKRFIDIASFFASITDLNSITFSEADRFDYEIYKLFIEWQKEFPDKNFEKEFPAFNKFWEELADWKPEDEWKKEKCIKIVNLAKRALEEIIEDE